MEEVKCHECGKDFASERSLHAHIKKHDMSLADFYEKHFPRKNLLTGESIKFKNKEDYFGRFFDNYSQMEKFLNSGDLRAKGVAKELLRRRIEAKKYDRAPCHVEMKLLELPSIQTYRKLFGSYKAVCDELGVKPLFGDCIPKNMEVNVEIPILIDTREQKPFVFPNSITTKLHVGDYTCTGERFSNTFVERKSESDFIGTLGQSGFERFCKEIQRAKMHGAHIFVVVENTVEKIIKNSLFKKYRSSMAYVWHNMRKIQHMYPDSVQFVFLDGRIEAQKLTRSILYHGKRIWGCDLQYYVDNIIKKETSDVG